MRVFVLNIFQNSNVGLVTGSKGKILKTTDGGETWVDKSVSNSLYPIDVVLFNSGLGYFIDYYGLGIYKTTDTGENWNYHTFSGFNGNPAKIKFLDDNIGFIVGINGGISRSTNSGDSWNVIASGTTSSLWGVDFLNSNTGIAVGADGIILKLLMEVLLGIQLLVAQLHS